MKKKLLSILLALTLSMSMMSAFAVTSFADDTQAPVVTATQTVDNNAGFRWHKVKTVKSYPLIGVDLCKIYKATDRKAVLKNSVNLLKELSKINWKSGAKNWTAVMNQLKALNSSIKIEAEDVVLFSTNPKGPWSPVLIAKPGDMVLVKANQFSYAEAEKNNMPKILESNKTYIYLQMLCGAPDMMYGFEMPNKVVTGADFVHVQ